MYLKYGTLNGKKFLSIAHNYRDPKTKKVRAKIVKSLGYFDELEKQFPDPITHFKKIIAEMNEKEKEEKASLNIKINPNIRPPRKLAFGGFLSKFFVMQGVAYAA